MQNGRCLKKTAKVTSRPQRFKCFKRNAKPSLFEKNSKGHFPDSTRVKK
jgi:hypothetical protein